MKVFFSQYPFVSAELADDELGDDDVFVLESIAEAKKNDDDKLRVTMVLSLKDAMASLARILKVIEVRSGSPDFETF